MKKKLTIPEYIVLFAITLMVVTIMGKILMSYPLLIVDRNNLVITEKEGWVRYVKTTGKYASQTLWFSEGEKSEQIILVCMNEDSNYVSSSSCKLSTELLKEMPKERNYTSWKSASVKIAHIDIPILNAIYKHAILIEK